MTIGLSAGGLLDAINSKGKKFVCIFTGGGSSFQQLFMTHPGASKSAILWQMPYATEALNAVLGGPPAKYCSEETARHMAVVAYRQSLRFGGEIGLAATCSLATTEAKRGPHQFFLAIQTSSETKTFSVSLCKGLRSRLGEEELVAFEMLKMLASSYEVNVDDFIPSKPKSGVCYLLDSEESTVQTNHVTVINKLQIAVMQQTAVAAEMRSHIQNASPSNRPLLVFPGSFDPYHTGHKNMFAKAQAMFPSHSPILEICINNVGGKRPLDYIDMQRRDQQIRSVSDHRPFFTDLPLFADKALYFGSQSIFVVGIDTLVRLADPQYCAVRIGPRNSEELRKWMIDMYTSAGCRFLVFGRVDANGKFRSIESHPEIPLEIKQLCIPVPENEFRIDISSTQLRNQAK